MKLAPALPRGAGLTDASPVSPKQGYAKMTDTQIAKLFDRLGRTERARRSADAAVRAARPAYAANHGLLAFPSVEAMRRGVAS